MSTTAAAGAGPQQTGETLDGEVEHLVYSGDETGYTVARLRVPGKQEPVTVVGVMPGVQVGERLHLEGRFLQHPRYGLQFQAITYHTSLPATAAAIKAYLGSKLVKGIGPVMAGRLTSHFGDDTLQVIDETPERLLEVPGIGPGRVRSIQAAWTAQRAVREVMIALQGHGISAAYATRIYRAYGEDAVRIVQEEPYRLARDIRGIGFKTADRIAQQLGMDSQDPARVQAGLEHTLSEFSDEGHVYVPRETLVSACSERLELPPDLVEAGVGALAEAGRVVVEPVGAHTAVYLAGLHWAERGAAGGLQRLMRAPLNRRSFDPDRAVAWAEKHQGLQLTETQRAAVRMAVTEKVAIITGGPGTGKTTILRAALTVLGRLGLQLTLAAPTGRAAKRLSEATGRPASTLHRLLGSNPGTGGFERDADNPLATDVIVVDEVSMVDVLLCYHLLRAIPSQAALLLVGDADQLPSVGPGNVLRDLLAAGVVPAVRLTEVFRQAQESRIVTNAHRINHGQMPQVPDRGQASDFYMVEAEDPEHVAELVVELCARRIPRRFGLDPLRDVQVVVPMNRGSAGAAALNARLQEALNPEGPAVTRFGRTFREQDRVLQTANDYDKGVFNGELGWVRGVDTDGGTLTVDFDTGVVEYDFSELDELLPAYAVTVHRSQGSEYPAVVVPVVMQHYPMLQRNLLYTAVTRARQLAVLVGSRRAIGLCVKNLRADGRYTGLRERLRRSVASVPGVLE